MSLELFVISLYFLVLLIIAYFSSRRCNDSVSAFAVADKKIHPTILLLTFIATSFGAGSTIGDAAKIMKDGIILPISLSGFFIFCVYMIKYIAPKFDDRFAGMISAGDMIKYFYGPVAEKIASIIGFLSGALLVGSQITAIGHIFGSVTSLSYQQMVISSGVILVLYSALGGVRSVIATDVFQAIFIIIFFPILAYILVSKAGGIGMAFSGLPAENYRIFSHPKFWEFFWYFLIAFTPFLWLYPPLIQRFLMSKDHKPIKAMYKYEIIIRLPLKLMLVMIVGSAYILIPGVTPTAVIPEIIREVLPRSIALLFLITIISTAMSTADSHLNSSAILLCHNVLKKLFKHDRIELLAMKVISLVIGIIAIITASLKLEIVPLILFSFSLAGCLIGMPILFGVIGLPVSSNNFYCCMIFSVITLIYLFFFSELGGLYYSTMPLIFGMLGFFLPFVVVRKGEQS